MHISRRAAAVRAAVLTGLASTVPCPQDTRRRLHAVVRVRACGHARVPPVTVKPAAIPAPAELISGRHHAGSPQSPIEPPRRPPCASTS